MNKNYIWGVSILIGTCIGAGVLGIPYVASKSGFWAAVGHIIFIGLVVLLANLYLGEVSLRTKGKHQLIEYARRYLGKNGKRLMNFAVMFGIYSALIAYTLGIGESLSFLILGNINNVILFGVGFALVMSFILKKGMSSLKKYERYGVSLVLVLLVLILIVFIGDVEVSNLSYINVQNLFLPFGVVLFALISFHAIPEINVLLGKKKDKSLMKKILITGSILSILFYIIFAFIVVGFKGDATPEIATLGLGKIFVILGIFTMFTSYLALGNALQEDYFFDKGFKKKKAWIYSTIVPIGAFILIKLTSEFFSFTKILSIGGVVSGGLIAVMSLFIVKSAKKKGDRKPEYSIPVNWFWIVLLATIFISGAVLEILNYF